MSTRPVGPREAQLRAMREATRQPARPVTASELKNAVATTSGKNPVKQKAKKKARR